ncbi:MAG: ribonuclease HII [Firmicutes bacterium]|nr:ribonuclease HII [Bacillota bacterium]
MTKENRTQRIFEYDKAYLPKMIAGMDEAGRGCLAGPLVAAICVMPLDCSIEGIYDSKALSKEKREELFEKIVERAISYEITECGVDIIDKLNILGATKQTMRDTVNKMLLKPSLVLVDFVPKLDIDIDFKTLKKGDQTSYNIACASILAKVHRDRLMIELDKKYPLYGFRDNKGYGTQRHIEALKKFGKTVEHRESFIKNFFVEQVSFLN